MNYKYVKVVVNKWEGEGGKINDNIGLITW
jgi:hypothetical protein